MYNVYYIPSRTRGIACARRNAADVYFHYYVGGTSIGTGFFSKAIVQNIRI